MRVIKPLAGKVTISRTSSNVDGDCVTITLIDESSSCQLVEVSMSMEAFGLAVTGLSRVECEYLLTAENAGKVRQVKTESVALPGGSGIRDKKKAAEALAPYEVDGWKGRKEDLHNPHLISGGKASVTFIRFVDKALPAPEKTE